MPFAEALARRGGGTLLATSYPTQAKRFWPAFETFEMAPLLAADVALVLDQAGLHADAREVAAASGGWPRYLRVLLDGLRARRDVVTTWADEMAPGGRLDLLCRHTYETLLLRSRGYGMSKAVLATVAAEEGLNLTALVARLGRTPGAVRDYLVWLVGVDALKMVRKRYSYVDPIVRWWVRLHGRGRPPLVAELQAAARSVAGEAGAPLPADESAASPRRDDTLMEID